MDLFAEAKSRGIQTEFVDGQGRRRVTGAEALKIILDALPSENPGPLIRQPVVIRSGRPAKSEISQAVALPVRWKIVTPLKVIAEGEASGRVVVWPQDLPLGVYRLQLIDAASTSAGNQRRTLSSAIRSVIVVPAEIRSRPSKWEIEGANSTTRLTSTTTVGVSVRSRRRMIRSVPPASTRASEPYSSSSETASSSVSGLV